MAKTQRGAGQSATLTLGNPSPTPAPQDRLPWTENLHPAPPKLLFHRKLPGGDTQQPGRRNVSGMSCRRWWKSRQVSQNNLQFTKNQTRACQGKQSTQESTDTHTHTHPLTPRASKKVIYSTTFKNIIPLMDYSICSLPNSKLLTL